MMSEMVLIDQKRDQIWMEVEEYLGEIERIAKNGPKPSDEILVRKVFCLMMGEIGYRQILRQEEL
jgi:hypothetical protein